MKVIGTIKSTFPINAFSTPIFIGKDRKYYVQKIINDKIECFEEFDIEESEIIKVYSKITFKINDDAIYCYVTEDEKLIIGTLNSIRDKMFDLLNNNELNPIAKVMIASAYNFHGKTSELVTESNNLFTKLGINCILNKKDYIHTIPWDQKDNEAFIEKLFSCKHIIENYKTIDWLDYAEFDDEKLKIKKFSISIDNFNSIKEERLNIISDDIVKSILDGIQTKKLNRNKLESNEFIYKLFLNSETSYSKFDEILFPKSKSKNYMISDYHLENGLGRQENKFNMVENLDDFSDLERIVEVSKKIKFNVTANSYDE